MPAFDLSGMYKDLAESIPGYSSLARGAMQQQELMNRSLEYQKSKEDFEAQRGLRALFAQNPNASIEEAAQYSPAFAQELMKNRFAMQKDLLGMEETKQKMEKGQKEMSEMDRKIVSETLGPIAEHALITGDMEGYKQAVGRAASELKSRGINLPMNFDPAQHTPDAVLRNATGGGYKSPLIQQQMDVGTQQQLSNIPNRPSGGTIQTTPEGFQLPVGPGTNLPPGGAGPNGPSGPPMGGGGGGQQPLFRNPPTGNGLANPNANAGPPNAGSPGELSYGNVDQSGMTQKPITPGDVDLLRQQYQSMKAGPQKEIVGKMLADAVRQTLPNGGVHADQAQVTTPEELADIRAKNKARETAAVKEAEAEVGRKEENTRITESFKRAMGEGGVSRVMKMISESTSGATESYAAKAIGAAPFSKATSGMENIGALNTIAGELRKTIERSPGAQSDKDVALAALDAAAISDPSIPYNQRMKGFLEFTKIIKERAKDLGIDPKELGIDVDTSTGSRMPTAKTDEEAEWLVRTLKPGDSFVGPDGKTHKIKGL